MKKHSYLFLLLVLCTTALSFAAITKVIIPCAGFGSRFFPLTKVVPKELIPLGDKPAIHYIVKEALDAGLVDICLITNERKTSIKDYFTHDAHSPFKDNPRYHLIKNAEQTFQNAQFSYIDQPFPRGTGDAVLIAQEQIGNEFFALMYPDDIVFGTSAIDELLAIANEHKVSVIAVQEVPLESVKNYGVVSIKKQISNTCYEISDIVEKPNPENAPSNLAVIGRYVFSPAIFDALQKIEPSHASGELQITEAIAHMMHHGHRIFVCKISGTRFDTGTPQGWAQAVAAELKLH